MNLRELEFEAKLGVEPKHPYMESLQLLVSFVVIVKKVYFYLKVSVRESFIWWFTPQMAAIVETWAD